MSRARGAADNKGNLKMKKQARELKRGDVIVGALQGENLQPMAKPFERVVVAARTNGPCVFVHLATEQGVSGAVSLHETEELETLPDAATRALTPAQQHADGLVRSLRALLSFVDIYVPAATKGPHTPEISKARQVLADASPPQAPTYAEVLEALAQLRGQVETTSDDTRQADQLLEQARRAGVMQ